MGTEVAKPSRTELAQDTSNDPFAYAGQELAGSSALYSKFNGNSGEFSYGANATEIEEGEKLAANVGAARRGWICWVDSEVAEEIMVPIASGQPPLEHTLTDHGPYKKHDDGTEDGWSAQFALDFRLLGDEHDGAEIVYKTSTKSAMRPLGDLVKQFAREYKSNPGKIPIVEFTKGSYMPKEKKHGKKYFPIFKIVDWIDEDELMETYGPDSSVEEGDENPNILPDTSAEDTAAEEAAAKKAEAKADKAAAKKVEQEESAAPEVAEDDEEAVLLKQLAEARAKKEAAAKAAEKAAATADTKPAPEGGRRNRRRSF